MRASAIGRLINAMSIQDRVRVVPSAAVSFLVNSGCAISRTLREERTEQGRFPRITFCEGLIPDAESSFLWLADVEVTNDHAKGLAELWPMKKKKDVVSHEDSSISGQVQNVC